MGTGEEYRIPPKKSTQAGEMLNLNICKRSKLNDHETPFGQSNGQLLL